MGADNAVIATLVGLCYHAGPAPRVGGGGGGGGGARRWLGNCACQSMHLACLDAMLWTFGHHAHSDQASECSGKGNTCSSHFKVS